MALLEDLYVGRIFIVSIFFFWASFWQIQVQALIAGTLSVFERVGNKEGESLVSWLLGWLVGQLWSFTLCFGLFFQGVAVKLHRCSLCQGLVDLFERC